MAVERAVSPWVGPILSLSLAIFAAAPATGSHVDPYDFQVDRFELQVGGSPVAIDEFDDGVVAPWTPFAGTVAESGGAVHLMSPGSDQVVQTTPPILSEVTVLVSPAAFQYTDGSGDASATVTWGPTIPPAPGGHMSAYLDYEIDATHHELIAVSISNWDASLSAAHNSVGPAPPAGLNVDFARVIYDITDASFAPQENQSIGFSPGDVSGNILFRIDFDDTANSFSGAYSLDGGSSFAAPFTPIEPSVSGFSGNWFLNVDPAVVIPEPGTGGLLALGLCALAARRSERIRKVA